MFALQPRMARTRTNAKSLSALQTIPQKKCTGERMKTNISEWEEGFNNQLKEFEQSIEAWEADLE